MHDTADDGFHEIHLSGKQLVFLFMATTVVSVLIFLCGVQVGRGVGAQQPQESFLESPATAAAPPTPPLADAGPPAAEPPLPPAETAELSYKKRLEGDATATESLKPRPAREQTGRSGSPPPKAAVAVSPEPVTSVPQPGTWIVQVHALRDRTVAAGIVQRLVARGYPAFLATGGTPSGIYRVQIGRFKDRGEAERVVERLKKEEQFKPWITR